MSTTQTRDWTSPTFDRPVVNYRAENGIAVIEMVVGAENPLAAIFDMNMFIMSAGRERSIEEFDALFAAAGLKRIAMHRTASPQVVIGLGPAEAD